MHSWHVFVRPWNRKKNPYWFDDVLVQKAKGSRKPSWKREKLGREKKIPLRYAFLPAKNSLGGDLTLEVETFQRVKLLSRTTKFVVINLRNWLISISVVFESDFNPDCWKFGRLEFFPDDLESGAWGLPCLEFAIESKSEVWNCFKLFSNHPVWTDVSGWYRIHIERSPHARW